ncbi:MAG: D-alanine--D-alanine ligase family protein [Candidatus Fermentibacteraceae bacterium]
MNVLVVSGGRSAERDVSLVSGAWVRKVLAESGHSVLDLRIGPGGDWTLYGEPLSICAGECPWKLLSDGSELPFDVVFPVLHGPFGEDGTVQGLCETAGWPYAGVPVMGCAVAMDKQTMRLLARDAGLPLLPWVFTDGSEDLLLFVEQAMHLGSTLFVKPSRMGSSVGISRAEGRDQLLAAIEAASRYDGRIVVERALSSPREIEVSVLGTGEHVEASVPGEIVPGREWYDYSAKYQCDDSRLVIPADLPETTALNLGLMARAAFRLLGGTGFARVDFLVDRVTGEVFFNEVNTIPGFTSISMFPKLWNASGLSSGKLLDAILSEAISRPLTGTAAKP